MPLVTSSHRSQLMMVSLEEKIEADNIVRVVDAFITCVDPKELGFIIKGDKLEGRPAYAAATLIKLYLYGYLNSVRSSRKLHAESIRNIELWWLLDNQTPSYKTIANFRKDNPEAFKKLFVCFRNFCLKLGLYGKTTVAIDGSKFRAQNSKKNNYNVKKIQQHLDYIEEQTADYIRQLDDNDDIESDKKIQDLKNRKAKYENLQEQLENTDQLQISTTDPDARALPLKMSIVEVAYNNQIAVDDKHYLIADFEITNVADSESLHSLSKTTKDAFGIKEKESLTTLADKGYYKGSEIKKCQDDNIDTLVAIRKSPNKNKAPEVRKDKFTYNKSKDNYTCPTGSILKGEGTYSRKLRGKKQNTFTRYIADHRDCVSCPLYTLCVSATRQSRQKGKQIDRSEYEDARAINDDNIAARKNEYRRRQAIVEHPFGTIKRQFGYTYTLMKGLQNVNTEFSIIHLCYNLKRVIQIMGIKQLLEALLAAFGLIWAHNTLWCISDLYPNLYYTKSHASSCCYS
jgi:transposase